jgi:hypothetical protein
MTNLNINKRTKIEVGRDEICLGLSIFLGIIMQNCRINADSNYKGCFKTSWRPGSKQEPAISETGPQVPYRDIFGNALYYTTFSTPCTFNFSNLNKREVF